MFPTSIKRIVVVGFENKSYNGVVASGPFFKALADTYSRPTNEMDNNNPSLPNYLAISCGSNLGISNDSMSGFPKNIPNIFRSLTSVGLTYGNWAENYLYPGAGKDNCGSGGPCNSAPTVCHHTPGTFYTDSVNGIKQLTDFYIRFRDGNEIPPNYCFISPSNCCNAHDCSIVTADSWLKNTFNLPKLMTKPWYTDGSTCFIIWFDEGYGSPRYDVFVSPLSMKHDHTGSTSGFEGLSTVMWLLGLPGTLNNSDASKAMKDLFSSPPPPVTRYRCSGSPNYQCIEDPNGHFNSLAECQSVCKHIPPPTGKITVTNPTAGLVYRIGESRVVRWASTNNVGANVKIELMRANILIKILASSTPNDGQMAWTVPAVTPATDYQVIVTSTTTQIFGISGKFAIK